MSSLERELMGKISRLDEGKQRQVLEFVERIEAPAPPSSRLSPTELMKLSESRFWRGRHSYRPRQNRDSLTMQWLKTQQRMPTKSGQFQPVDSRGN